MHNPIIKIKNKLLMFLNIRENHLLLIPWGRIPYWEAKFSATPHEISSLLWNRKVYWQSRNSSSWDICSQHGHFQHLPISVHIFTAVLTSNLRYRKFVCIYHPSHPCYKPHQSCLRQLTIRIIFFWTTKIMRILKKLFYELHVHYF
jgi:hypothetical protein